MYIAVCDDQIEELEKLTALLQAWQSDLHSDVRFQTFRSGGQLLDAARAERFTLYLLDVLMPGMTGMEPHGRSVPSTRRRTSSFSPPLPASPTKATASGRRSICSSPSMPSCSIRCWTSCICGIRSRRTA